MADQVERGEEKENLCVRKWMLDDICDLDRNESWFSDMAEQGLFIDHFGRWSAYFRRETSHKTRYRMDVLSRELTEDELALYDSCGWHFAALNRERTNWNPVYYYIFQTDENATVPELHTDPMEQAASLRKLHRGSCWGFWIMLAVFLALAGFQVWTYLYSYRRFDYLVNGNVTDVYWFLFYVLELQNSLRHWRNIRRLRKRLAGGEPLDHHADYRAAHRHYALTAYWKLPLWLLLVAALIAQTAHEYRDDVHPLPEGATDFPAVRLEEVRGGLTGENAIWGETRHEWTMTGVVADEIREWEYADDVETGSQVELNTVCYRFPLAWTTDMAFDALQENWYYGLSEVYWTGGGVPVETGLVDEAWTQAPCEKNHWRFALYIRDGRYIVTTFYLDRAYGDFDDPEVAEAFRDQCVEKILPLLAQRLNG
ncbi:MAG: DUF2812 domain-containing protein [Oscillibacter sp.]|nr:DUF2812 domain-containing protein [Oscillibacter sp.]